MTDTVTLPRSVVEQALAITTHWLELDKRNHCDLLTVSEYKLITGAVENLRAALAQPQGEQEPTPNGATHRQPKQGAFYKRVDGKWYVWSRMENGGPHRWYISPGTIEGCLEPLYTHPQNLNCKSTQARLATLWGYEKPQPKRDPLSDEQILKLGWAVTPYANQMEMLSIARAIEAAHGIGGEA